MKTFLAIVAVALVCSATLGDELRREPRMTLPERVAGATLITVGKFGPPGNTGKLTTTSVRVEEVLLGSIPSGKTLFVTYTSSLWLIPEIAAYPEPVAKPGSRWIFFLSDADVKQVAGTNYYTRAVGPHKYAHDGFELANDEMLQKVLKLTAVPMVTIADLLAHMKNYRGKRVEVAGYYKSSSEVSSLYQNQEDADALRDERALHIMPFVRSGYEKRVKFVKQGKVRIAGVFDYNVQQPELGVGHLNGWPARIVALELFEEIK